MYASKERNIRLATRLVEHVRAKSTDIFDSIMSYDLSIYTDPELAKQERVNIFQTQPMMAAHSSEISEPHDFITLRLNGSEILLTRKPSGEVGAFLNVCRHRGATLVQEKKGNRRNFSCPYHGWVFGSEGQHKMIAYDSSFGQQACESLNLIELPVEERHGFIWVVEDPKASIDVAAHLGEMDAALAEYEFDQWHHYRTHELEFPQNWKIMMDGLLDGYHVEFVHGDTIGPFMHNNTLALEAFGDHALWFTPRRTIDEILDKEPSEGLLEKYILVGNLFAPNSVITMHPHHIEYWTIFQDTKDPGKCRALLRYVTREKELTSDYIRILDKNFKIASNAILQEDVPLGNSVQVSADSHFSGKAILGKNEMMNQLFHRNYNRLMGMK